MDKDKIIYELYKLLDDIDTGEDIFKSDKEGYSKYVHKKHKQRFDVVEDGYCEELYNKYYPDKNTMSRNAK